MGEGARHVLGRPARASFSATHLVAVRLCGELRHHATPVDDGLVAQLLAFLVEEGIHPATGGGYSMRGDHLGFYTPADAERIAEWLRAHGVEEVALDEQ